MTLDEFIKKYELSEIKNNFYVYYKLCIPNMDLYGDEDDRCFHISFKNLKYKLKETKEYLKYIENNLYFVRWQTPNIVNDIFSMKIEIEEYKEENIEWL